MNVMRLDWLGRWLLPHGETTVTGAEHDREAEAAERALAEAETAAREFERVKRRVRAMGVEVDVARSWGPHDQRGGRGQSC